MVQVTNTASGDVVTGSAAIPGRVPVRTPLPSHQHVGRFNYDKRLAGNQMRGGQVDT